MQRGPRVPAAGKPQAVARLGPEGVETTSRSGGSGRLAGVRRRAWRTAASCAASDDFLLVQFHYFLLVQFHYFFLDASCPRRRRYKL